MSANWLMPRILELRYRGEPPEEWSSDVRRLSFVDTLTDGERRRLVQPARMFDSVARFDGRHGVVVEDHMRRIIALHAGWDGPRPRGRRIRRPHRLLLARGRDRRGVGRRRAQRRLVRAEAVESAYRRRRRGKRADS